MRYTLVASNTSGAIVKFRGETIKSVINQFDNDYVIFNRAPSLLSEACTALKVRTINTGFTLQINVTQCSLFNADFDGDTMTTHHPSITGYEAFKASGTVNSFISYGTGGPIIGEAQDSIIGCCIFISAC